MSFPLLLDTLHSQQKFGILCFTCTAYHYFWHNFSSHAYGMGGQLYVFKGGTVTIWLQVLTTSRVDLKRGKQMLKISLDFAQVPVYIHVECCPNKLKIISSYHCCFTPYTAIKIWVLLVYTSLQTLKCLYLYIRYFIIIVSKIQWLFTYSCCIFIVNFGSSLCATIHLVSFPFPSTNSGVTQSLTLCASLPVTLSFWLSYCLLRNDIPS